MDKYANLQKVQMNQLVFLKSKAFAYLLIGKLAHSALKSYGSISATFSQPQ